MANIYLLPENIRSKIRIVGSCWIWEGARNGKDSRYGRVSYKQRLWYTHRIVYTLLIGPIPEGLMLDHKIEEGICSSTYCCNPSHMNLATNKENINKWRDATYVPRTYCPQGHLLAGDNLYQPPNRPTRICRICSNASSNKYYHTKRKGLVAKRSQQHPHKMPIVGSTPTQPTTSEVDNAS